MIAPNVKTKRLKRTTPKGSNRVLRFTPYSMAKLLYLRDIGPTEVGGFGISNADDLLLVEDIQLVEQVCSIVSVEFNDRSVADFFDQQVDAGRQPEQFARIWIHTHPGSSPAPSGTDEDTFHRCFGGVDWAVMHIVAKEGDTYSRARYNVGPGAEKRLRCRTEFGNEFPAADHEAWFLEYCENVSIYEPFLSTHYEIDESNWWDQASPKPNRWSGSVEVVH